MTVRYDLPREFFATRHGARQIRASVEVLSIDRSITLGFGRVEAITGAFADELVCRLIADGWDVTIERANADVAEVIHRAIQRRADNNA